MLVINLTYSATEGTTSIHRTIASWADYDKLGLKCHKLGLCVFCKFNLRI